MENLFLTGVPKIAIFLLFFALVGLLFEILYFRRKRLHEEVTPTAPSEPGNTRISRKNLVILGVLLILLVLPASLYLVSQKVNLKQEAQVTQQNEPLQYGCDEIDILRNYVIVDPSALSANDTVTFAAYCYAQGATATGANVNRARFTLRTPPGETSTATYLATPVPEKNTSTRQYFQSFYPNVKLAQTGAYTVSVLPYNLENALSQQSFARNFTLTGTAVNSTPTTAPGVAQQGNTSPVCNSLSAIPLTGPAPLPVSLTGSGTDSDGQIAAFEFTFGDLAKQTVNKNVGSSGSASISHVYQTTGNYTASLRVLDNSGNFSPPTPLCSVQITVATGSATTSATLKAQPTKVTTPTPTTIALPQAGIGLPLVGMIGTGLLLLTLGLLLAF